MHEMYLKMAFFGREDWICLECGRVIRRLADGTKFIFLPGDEVVFHSDGDRRADAPPPIISLPIDHPSLDAFQDWINSHL